MVTGRTSFADMLSSIKGGGALEEYLKPASLKPWINMNLVLEGSLAWMTWVAVYVSMS